MTTRAKIKAMRAQKYQSKRTKKLDRGSRFKGQSMFSAKLGADGASRISQLVHSLKNK